MKIVVTTIVSLNPGDAAILQGSLAILQEAFGHDLSVTVFDRNGDDAGQYYPWAEYRPALFRERRRGALVEWIKRRGYAHRVHWLDWHRLRLGARLLERGHRRAAALLTSREERESLEEYLAADLVIANGGTYLVPHYDVQVPVLDYELTRALEKPLVFFPQSMGPFRDMGERDRLAAIFRDALRVYVRDPRSAEHLEEIGVPAPRVQVHADAAFALAPEDPPAPARDPSPEDGPAVAISVREWRHFRSGDPDTRYAAYLDDIAALATHLVRAYRARVTFLSTCQGMPEYWTDDAEVAAEVARRLDPDVAAAVQVDGRFHAPVDLMHELQRFDLAVATRMHFAILALSARVPVLAIAYEFKTTELFEAMGLGSWVVDIEALDGGTLAARADGLMAALPDVRRQVAAATDERRRSARGVAADLVALGVGQAV